MKFLVEVPDELITLIKESFEMAADTTDADAITELLSGKIDSEFGKEFNVKVSKIKSATEITEEYRKTFGDLLDLLKACGFKLLYMDTDSCYLTKEVE